MEIYNFYTIIKSTLLLLFEGRVREDMIPLYACIGGAVLFAAIFVLQGVGIATMAKKRGMARRWLAFVPFANIWYLGKLAGDCQFFGQRMKRGGLYAMLGQILATVATCAMIAAETYLWVNHGAPKFVENPYWTELTGFSYFVSQFYDISAYITSIFQLVCEILLFVVLTSLYKQYEPRNYLALSMLTLFVPLSRFIIIFVLRNRKAIDFNAYMRARREAFARRRQQQYQNYNNPYGNPYAQNPHDPYGRPQPPKNEEPFEEFSSSSNKGTGSNKEENSDGFFD